MYWKQYSYILYMRNLLSGIISVGIASLIILVSILTRIIPTFFDIHRVFWKSPLIKEGYGLLLKISTFFQKYPPKIDEITHSAMFFLPCKSRELPISYQNALSITFLKNKLWTGYIVFSIPTEIIQKEYQYTDRNNSECSIQEWTLKLCQ